MTICVATVTAICLTAFYQPPSPPVLPPSPKGCCTYSVRTTILPNLVAVSQSLSLPDTHVGLHSRPLTSLLPHSEFDWHDFSHLSGHSFAFQQWFLLLVSDSSTYTGTSWICMLGILQVISNVICPTLLSFYFHAIPVPFHDFCISMNINTIFLTILSDKREWMETQNYPYSPTNLPLNISWLHFLPTIISLFSSWSFLPCITASVLCCSSWHQHLSLWKLSVPWSVTSGLHMVFRSKALSF